MSKQSVVHAQVTWQSIVGKEFMETFLTLACIDTGSSMENCVSWDILRKTFDKDEIAQYREKRSQIRQHGWYRCFTTSTGRIGFMTMHDPNHTRFVSLRNYLKKSGTPPTPGSFDTVISKSNQEFSKPKNSPALIGKTTGTKARKVLIPIDGRVE
jgi:hypothetical protein